MSRILTVIVAIVAFSVTFAAQAHAGDVKLLKQPSAFPLVISKPGSYRLKSNITVPEANTTAISIKADNVTLDLNGYSITGPTACSGRAAGDELHSNRYRQRRRFLHQWECGHDRA